MIYMFLYLEVLYFEELFSPFDFLLNMFVL